MTQFRPMKLRIDSRYSFAFTSLLLLMHELHEIAHTYTGRVLCGCWGHRDFNVWELCEGCLDERPYAILATIAGPAFTFGMIWLGDYFLQKDREGLGFSLIFANMPLARIGTALWGGGDENYALKHLIDLDHDTSRYLVFALILGIVLLPLYRAYRMIQNRYKLLWFLGFLFLPVVIDIILVLGVMNTLLNTGFLAFTWMGDAPFLLTLWTLLILALCVLSRRWLERLVTH